MRRTILTTCCLALLGAAAGSLADEAAKAPAKAPTKTEKAHPDCVQETGTHIRSRNRPCVTSSPTRSYTQEELNQTGEPNLADALKKLDPRLH